MKAHTTTKRVEEDGILRGHTSCLPFFLEDWMKYNNSNQLDSVISGLISKLTKTT